MFNLRLMNLLQLQGRMARGPLTPLTATKHLKNVDTHQISYTHDDRDMTTELETDLQPQI